MSHKSDLITRQGLERIREHCFHHLSCYNCLIKQQCDEFMDLINFIPISYPTHWTDDYISEILKATRNYMEATFIESLEKIVEQGGDCGCIECDDCPFLHTDTQIDCHNDNCSTTPLHKVKMARLTERKEIAEWLLEIYKGERE